MDKISNLPVDVINQILSRNRLRDAIRTSVLSKNWRYKWTTIPNLVFDKQCFSTFSQDETELISIVVDYVLILHNGPLDKFKFYHRDFQGVTVNNLDRWIRRVSCKSVKEFILEIGKGKRYEVPSSLFYCRSLIHLDLRSCLLKPPSTFKGFKNMKSLCLHRITMGQDVFENLIRNCSLLERLNLNNFNGFGDLNIDAPNLQFVDIGGYFNIVRFKNTFRLNSVSIDLYENGQTLSPGRPNELLTFFVHLPHIQSLRIERYFLKYLAKDCVPSWLPHLSYLSISINLNDLDEGLAALCLFRSSPNLQELEISVRPQEAPMGTVVRFWNINDPWNLIFAKLRLVKIEWISGTTSEMDFINLLLLNSPVLERISLKLRVWRASRAAKIIYL